MRDYISRPQSETYRLAHAKTFGEGLTRGRWLEEGGADETFAEWKARVTGCRCSGRPAGWSCPCGTWNECRATSGAFDEMCWNCNVKNGKRKTDE